MICQSDASRWVSTNLRPPTVKPDSLRPRWAIDSRKLHLTYCPSEVASRNLASRRLLRSIRPVRRSSRHNRSICSKVNLNPGISRYSDRIRSICSLSGSQRFVFLVMSDPSSELESNASGSRNNGTVWKIAHYAGLPTSGSRKAVSVWDDHFILQVLEAQGRVRLLRSATALWRQLDCSSVDKT